MPIYLDPAKSHAEPGFLFNPPHERAFRLSDSALSGPLFKGFGVQEMDFGWWDEPEQTMNLLEVKDYTKGTFSAEHYVNECAQKATDCLLLLASIWYALPYGLEVRECLPVEWRTLPIAPPRVHLFFVMKEPQSTDPVGMSALQDRVRSKMRGRIELLKLTPATKLFLMNHRVAAHQLPLTTEDDFLAESAPARPKPSRKR
ncbi:MAG: hypothetical protein ABJE95_01330 [Byssovorax sp.]